MLQLDPALPTLAQRGIAWGIDNLRRGGSWKTSLGALLGVFLLVQLLVLTLLGVEGVRALLRTHSDLRLEIREAAADGDIQEFLSALQQLPAVEEVVYITREQAYERARKRDPELIRFLEEFHLENPFPETIGVTLRSLDDYADFSSFVEQRQWQAVIDPAFLSEITDQEARIHELLRLTNAGKSFTLLFLLVTAATLVFVTVEIVRGRVLARADEVLVQRLVGAHLLSIVLPFATEATLLSWGAAGASAAALLAFIWLLPGFVPALGAAGALQALSAEVVPLLWTQLPWILLAELFLAPIIAGIGAWLGMRPQLTARTINVLP